MDPELLALPKPSASEKTSVPPPKSLPLNDLSMWKKLPSDNKCPVPKLPERDIELYRTELGKTLYHTYPGKKFDLTGTENHSIPAESYNSLHDPNLRVYFQSTPSYKRLVSKGLITADGKVKADIAEYNQYRMYLHHLWVMQIDQLRQNQEAEEAKRLQSLLEAVEKDDTLCKKIIDNEDTVNADVVMEKLAAKLDEKDFASEWRENSLIRSLINWKNYQKKLEKNYKNDYPTLKRWLNDQTKHYKCFMEKKINARKCKDKNMRLRWEKIRENSRNCYNRVMKLQERHREKQRILAEKRQNLHKKMWNQYKREIAQRASKSNHKGHRDEGTSVGQDTTSKANSGISERLWDFSNRKDLSLEDAKKSSFSSSDFRDLIMDDSCELEDLTDKSSQSLTKTPFSETKGFSKRSYPSASAQNSSFGSSDTWTTVSDKEADNVFDTASGIVESVKKKIRFSLSRSSSEGKKTSAIFYQDKKNPSIRYSSSTDNDFLDSSLETLKIKKKIIKPYKQIRMKKRHKINGEFIKSKLKSPYEISIRGSDISRIISKPQPHQQSMKISKESNREKHDIRTPKRYSSLDADDSSMLLKYLYGLPGSPGDIEKIPATHTSQLKTMSESQISTTCDSMDFSTNSKTDEDTDSSNGEQSKSKDSDSGTRNEHLRVPQKETNLSNEQLRDSRILIDIDKKSFKPDSPTDIQNKDRYHPETKVALVENNYPLDLKTMDIEANEFSENRAPQHTRQASKKERQSQVTKSIKDQVVKTKHQHDTEKEFNFKRLAKDPLEKTEVKSKSFKPIKYEQSKLKTPTAKDSETGKIFKSNGQVNDKMYTKSKSKIPSKENGKDSKEISKKMQNCKFHEMQGNDLEGLESKKKFDLKEDLEKEICLGTGRVSEMIKCKKSSPIASSTDVPFISKESIFQAKKLKKEDVKDDRISKESTAKNKTKELRKPSSESKPASERDKLKLKIKDSSKKISKIDMNKQKSKNPKITSKKDNSNETSCTDDPSTAKKSRTLSTIKERANCEDRRISKTLSPEGKTDNHEMIITELIEKSTLPNDSYLEKGKLKPQASKRDQRCEFLENIGKDPERSSNKESVAENFLTKIASKTLSTTRNDGNFVDKRSSKESIDNYKTKMHEILSHESIEKDNSDDKRLRKDELNQKGKQFDKQGLEKHDIKFKTKDALKKPHISKRPKDLVQDSKESSSAATTPESSLIDSSAKTEIRIQSNRILKKSLSKNKTPERKILPHIYIQRTDGKGRKKDGIETRTRADLKKAFDNKLHKDTVNSSDSSSTDSSVESLEADASSLTIESISQSTTEKKEDIEDDSSLEKGENREGKIDSQDNIMHSYAKNDKKPRKTATSNKVTKRYLQKYLDKESKTSSTGPYAKHDMGSGTIDTTKNSPTSELFEDLYPDFEMNPSRENSESKYSGEYSSEESSSDRYSRDASSTEKVNILTSIRKKGNNLEVEASKGFNAQEQFKKYLHETLINTYGEDEGKLGTREPFKEHLRNEWHEDSEISSGEDKNLDLSSIDVPSRTKDNVLTPTADKKGDIRDDIDLPTKDKTKAFETIPMSDHEKENNVDKMTETEVVLRRTPENEHPVDVKKDGIESSDSQPISSQEELKGKMTQEIKRSEDYFSFRKYNLFHYGLKNKSPGSKKKKKSKVDVYKDVIEPDINRLEAISKTKKQQEVFRKKLNSDKNYFTFQDYNLGEQNIGFDKSKLDLDCDSEEEENRTCYETVNQFEKESVSHSKMSLKIKRGMSNYSFLLQKPKYYETQFKEEKSNTFTKHYDADREDSYEVKQESSDTLSCFKKIYEARNKKLHEDFKRYVISERSNSIYYDSSPDPEEDSPEKSHKLDEFFMDAYQDRKRKVNEEFKRYIADRRDENCLYNADMIPFISTNSKKSLLSSVESVEPSNKENIMTQKLSEKETQDIKEKETNETDLKGIKQITKSADKILAHRVDQSESNVFPKMKSEQTEDETEKEAEKSKTKQTDVRFKVGLDHHEEYGFTETKSKHMKEETEKKDKKLQPTPADKERFDCKEKHDFMETKLKPTKGEADNQDEKLRAISENKFFKQGVDRQENDVFKDIKLEQEEEETKKSGEKLKAKSEDKSIKQDIDLQDNDDFTETKLEQIEDETVKDGEKFKHVSEDKSSKEGVYRQKNYGFTEMELDLINDEANKEGENLRTIPTDINLKGGVDRQENDSNGMKSGQVKVEIKNEGEKQKIKPRNQSIKGDERIEIKREKKCVYKIDGEKYLYFTRISIPLDHTNSFSLSKELGLSDSSHTDNPRIQDIQALSTLKAKEKDDKEKQYEVFILEDAPSENKTSSLISSSKKVPTKVPGDIEFIESTDISVIDLSNKFERVESFSIANLISHITKEARGLEYVCTVSDPLIKLSDNIFISPNKTSFGKRSSNVTPEIKIISQQDPTLKDVKNQLIFGLQKLLNSTSPPLCNLEQAEEQQCSEFYAVCALDESVKQLPTQLESIMKVSAFDVENRTNVLNATKDFLFVIPSQEAIQGLEVVDENLDRVITNFQDPIKKPIITISSPTVWGSHNFFGRPTYFSPSKEDNASKSLYIPKSLPDTYFGTTSNVNSLLDRMLVETFEANRTQGESASQEMSSMFDTLIAKQKDCALKETLPFLKPVLHDLEREREDESLTISLPDSYHGSGSENNFMFDSSTTKQKYNSLKNNLPFLNSELSENEDESLPTPLPYAYYGSGFENDFKIKWNSALFNDFDAKVKVLGHYEKMDAMTDSTETIQKYHSLSKTLPPAEIQEDAGRLKFKDDIFKLVISIPDAYYATGSETHSLSDWICEPTDIDSKIFEIFKKPSVGENILNEKQVSFGLAKFLPPTKPEDGMAVMEYKDNIHKNADVRQKYVNVKKFLPPTKDHTAAVELNSFVQPSSVDNILTNIALPNAYYGTASVDDLFELHLTDKISEGRYTIQNYHTLQKNLPPSKLKIASDADKINQFSFETDNITIPTAYFATGGKKNFICEFNSDIKNKPQRKGKVHFKHSGGGQKFHILKKFLPPLKSEISNASDDYIESGLIELPDAYYGTGNKSLSAFSDDFVVNETRKVDVSHNVIYDRMDKQKYYNLTKILPPQKQKSDITAADITAKNISLQRTSKFQLSPKFSSLDAKEFVRLGQFKVSEVKPVVASPIHFTQDKIKHQKLKTLKFNQDFANVLQHLLNEEPKTATSAEDSSIIKQKPMSIEITGELLTLLKTLQDKLLEPIMESRREHRLYSIAPAFGTSYENQTWDSTFDFEDYTLLVDTSKTDPVILIKSPDQNTMIEWNITEFLKSPVLQTLDTSDVVQSSTSIVERQPPKIFENAMIPLNQPDKLEVIERPDFSKAEILEPGSKVLKENSPNPVIVKQIATEMDPSPKKVEYKGFQNDEGQEEDMIEALKDITVKHVIPKTLPRKQIVRVTSEERNLDPHYKMYINQNQKSGNDYYKDKFSDEEKADNSESEEKHTHYIETRNSDLNKDEIQKSGKQSSTLHEIYFHKLPVDKSFDLILRESLSQIDDEGRQEAMWSQGPSTSYIDVQHTPEEMQLLIPESPDRRRHGISAILNKINEEINRIELFYESKKKSRHVKKRSKSARRAEKNVFKTDSIRDETVMTAETDSDENDAI